MGLDDLLSRESALVATATAAVFSPRTRDTLRRGAVLGVAGALKAGDVVYGAARGMARGVRGEEQAASRSGNGRKRTPARQPARRSRSTRTRSGNSGSRSSSQASSGGGA